jgi:hypothetical protein
MPALIARLLPLARNFARQIVPPVLATLIAALLIAGFNRAFSSHLVQPRMAAMHSGSGETTRPVVYAPDPQEAVAATEASTVSEPTVPQRIFAKEDLREAGKDQGALKIASAPVAAPAPAPAAPVTPRVTRRIEAQANEPRVIERPIEPRVTAVPVVVGPAPMMAAPTMAAPMMAAPTTVAPAPAMTAPPVVVGQPIASMPQAQMLPPVAQGPQPVGPTTQPIAQQPLGAQGVAQEPPPVITAKPMVTVPDRPRQTASAYPGYEPRTPYQAQAYPQPQPYQQHAEAEQDIAPPREQRPLERFVDSIKPSSIFNRMREFGDRIEAAGNEILPSIRQ